MALRYYANAPATALTNSCTALATSIVVDSVAGLPITYPYTLIIDRGTASEEAVEVTAAAGTTLTVTRGADDTTAFAHPAAAEVVHGITARDIREANEHVNADSGVHGVTGDVVGTTDTQTLTNKTLTSPTLESPELTGSPIAPTPATADDDTTVATTAFVKAVLLAAHPVGTIRMQTVSTNPSSFIGGTWVAWGTGRVPVGIDATQTEFDSVEETGGAKTHTLTVDEMPAHVHQGGISDTTSFGVMGSGSYSLPSSSGTSGLPTSSTGGGGAHNNLQPYIVCYMFKRTA